MDRLQKGRNQVLRVDVLPLCDVFDEKGSAYSVGFRLGSSLIFPLYEYMYVKTSISYRFYTI